MVDLNVLKYYWEAHICNPLWHPVIKRRRRRENARVAHRMVKLKKYVPFVSRLKVKKIPDEIGINPSERIFSLWLQGEKKAPQLVKKCLKSIRDIYSDNFVLLTADNFKRYTSIPEYILEKWRKGQITPSHFSDIIRIDLLAREGGYWFDATDFLTGSIPEYIKKTDFFMFVPGDKGYSHMLVQTCFIRVKKGDALMRMWREVVLEYWKNEDKAIDYFMVHFLLRLLVTYNKEAQFLFEKMPKIKMDPTHVLWHEIGNKPFELEGYRKMCEGAFFQKCSYKPQRKRDAVNKLIPGLFADAVINGKAKLAEEAKTGGYQEIPFSQSVVFH